MKNLSFLLVVKFDSEERKENFAIVKDYLKANFPNSPILVNNRDCSPFHRTKYINELFQQCKTPFAAVWDVDIILDPGQVRAAVGLAEKSPLVYPYSLPWCVVPIAQKRLPWHELKKRENLLTDQQITVSVGGVYVCNVALWKACGWENENFIDWGPEDKERYWRARILTGRDCRRVKGPIFHLWHPQTPEKTWLQTQFNNNVAEFHRICSMPKTDLEKEIKSWTWTGGNGILVSSKQQEEEAKMPKIVTRLGIEDDAKSGRLGNKMFQAAACIGYGEKYGVKVILPAWALINTFGNIETSGNIQAYGPFGEHAEPHFHFKDIPDYRPADVSLSLKGYFQSEKYFSHCADKIRNFYFKPCETIEKYAKNVYDLVSCEGKARTTVIQVRRDDYLKKSDYHTVQPISYYAKAIEMLKDKTDMFVVFCDKSAEPWCKTEFDKLGIKWCLAPQDNYIGDIFVMSKCDNYIIANSTFGWWGAWLNPRPKTVICPINWFGPAAGLNDSDLIPNGWTRI